MKTFTRSASFSIKSSSSGVKSKIEKVKRLSVGSKLKPVHEKIPHRTDEISDRRTADLDSSLSDLSFSIESDDNVFCSLPRRVKVPVVKNTSPLVIDSQKCQPIKKAEKGSIFAKLKNLKRRKSKSSMGSNGEKHPSQILGTNSPILAANERLIDEIVIWEESFENHF